MALKKKETLAPRHCGPPDGKGRQPVGPEAESDEEPTGPIATKMQKQQTTSHLTSLRTAAEVAFHLGTLTEEDYKDLHQECPAAA